MSARRFASPLVAALILAVPAAPAATPVGDPIAAAKKKPQKCKKGTVRVVVGKKHSCRPLKKALPRPRKGDPRLIYVRAALGANLKGVRDRKGRRPPSIEKALRRISPKAVQGMQRVIPRALQLLDRGRAKAAQGGDSVGFTYDLGNGASIDVRANLAQANIQVAVTGRRNGQSIRTRIGINRDLGFRGPDCPTAAGVLDAKDGLRVAITTEFLDGDGDVDYYYTQVVFQDTKLHGQVGDDAKLDTLEVTDTLQLGEITGGSIFGGVNIESKIKRHTIVNMKNGHYDPGRSDVSVSVALSGILRIFQSSAEAGARERLQAAADKGFAATVERAIDKYRERESAWQTPNMCATLEFSLAPNTRRLRPGESGGFDATAIAKQGGGVSELVARLSNQVNATFSPTRASGQRARFGYTVASAPASDKVRSTVRATSKAGVAQGDWEQNVDRPNPPPAAYVGPVSGTAVYDQNELGAGNSLEASWSGNVVLRQVPTGYLPGTPGVPSARYALTAGSIQYGFNGRVGGCNVVGSAPIDLAAEQDVAGSAFLHVYDGTPRSYQLQIPMPLMVTVVGQNSVCDDPNDNGTDFSWVPGAGIPYLVNAPLPGGPVGDDWSLLGAGVGNNGPGTPDQTWQWSLGPSS
jgi:hypothetical protein